MSARNKVVVWVLLLVSTAVGGAEGRPDEEGAALSEAPIAIIPAPIHLERRPGVCRLNLSAPIDFDHPGAKRIASYLVSIWHRDPWLGGDLHGPNPVRIRLTAKGAEEALGAEGYRLETSSSGVVIRARKAAGLFWGVQTLRQLLPPEAEGGEDARTAGAVYEIPAVEIVDYPRFAWRGLHLDVGRHFFTADEVKRFLDLMVLFKLNTFHWHLTEDQGWRIEILEYPKLTQIGSRRAESPRKGSRTEGDGTPYGGFYTQDDIRAVVRYASERFVTIVPEIEMPGHAQAAIAAYPELGNTGETLPVRTRWGVSRHVYNVEEETFTFLENVLKEVMVLFPGTFIHIGGDECPKAEWKASPRAQERIKAEGLKDEHALQSWFIRRIERFLASHDRRLIGWDEIQEGGLPPNAAMMVWRNVKYGVEAAKRGHDVVMSPTSYCYFDYYQGDRAHEPEAIGGLLPLSRVYAFEPIPPELTPEEARHVLGAQGNLWTEYIPDFDQLTYMAYPRGAALAEVVWSKPEARDLEDFLRRWTVVSRHLDAMGVRYRLRPPRPLADAVVFQESGVVAFEPPAPGQTIRYTLDGSLPGPDAPRYEGPILVDRALTVTAAFFSAGGTRSAPVQVDAGCWVWTVNDEETALEPGARVEGYRGSFSRVPDRGSLEPAWSAEVDELGFTGREPADGFALWFEGWLRVDEPGLHTFTVGSDDGSILEIADARVVQNDGLHGFVRREGRVHLEKGTYPFELGYFERGGAERLEVTLPDGVTLLRTRTVTKDD